MTSSQPFIRRRALAASDKNKEAGGGGGGGGVLLSLVIVPSEIMLVQFEPDKVTVRAWREPAQTPEGEIFH